MLTQHLDGKHNLRRQHYFDLARTSRADPRIAGFPKRIDMRGIRSKEPATQIALTSRRKHQCGAISGTQTRQQGSRAPVLQWRSELAMKSDAYRIFHLRATLLIDYAADQALAGGIRVSNIGLDPGFEVDPPPPGWGRVDSVVNRAEPATGPPVSLGLAFGPAASAWRVR